MIPRLVARVGACGRLVRAAEERAATVFNGRRRDALGQTVGTVSLDALANGAPGGT
jgi:hypothetical protein